MKTDRELVLDLAMKAGDKGITFDDVIQKIGLLSSSASARLSELSRAGELRKTAERRRTSRGGTAYVFVHGAFGPTAPSPVTTRKHLAIVYLDEIPELLKRGDTAAVLQRVKDARSLLSGTKKSLKEQ
jgi:hypothetical protein